MSLPQEPTRLCWLVTQPEVLREAPEADAPPVLLLLPGAHLVLASGAAPSGPWLEVVYELATGATGHSEQWGGWVPVDRLLAAVGQTTQTTAHHQFPTSFQVTIPHLQIGLKVSYFPNSESKGLDVNLN